MSYKNCKIDDLVGADWNYKVESDFMSKQLAANMKRNGQIESLIVRDLGNGKFEVVNGNHRLDVMKQLGEATAHVYDLGKISDSQAKRIAIETNETRFASNHAELGNLLKDIEKEVGMDDLIETMPMTSHELTTMIEQNFVEWDEIDDAKNPENKKVEDADPETITCPDCGKVIDLP